MTTDIASTYTTLGRKVGLPNDLLCGSLSHACKWHACSIVEHVRWCEALAERLLELKVATDVLVVAARWHDIGKVIAPQFGEDGPTFHNHAETGACFLDEEGLLAPRLVELVRQHGRFRGATYPGDADPCLPLLDLCDELSKWSERRFPREGSDKQRLHRTVVLARIAEAGVQLDSIERLGREADGIADEIGLQWEVW